MPDVDDADAHEEVRFLDDVKVLEISNMAPNQLAMHLADLGAEVIKIEPPKRGDATRLIGKPRRGSTTRSSIAVGTEGRRASPST